MEQQLKSSRNCRHKKLVAVSGSAEAGAGRGLVCKRCRQLALPLVYEGLEQIQLGGNGGN